MQSPLVSVLMPAYNAEKYISEAIESILNQTFKDFEFIIVDDASTDKTWEIINKYAKKDKRIRAYKNIINLDIAGNRNRLIKLSKGEYIVWQDADDISYPYRIKEQYNFMEKHKKVGICGGYLLFFNNKGAMSIRKYAPDDISLRKTIFLYSPVAQPAAMIRKECFSKIGGYDLRFPPAEDIDVSFRIGQYYKFANLKKLLIKYRQYYGSATFKRLKKIEISTIKIRKLYYNSSFYKASFLDKIYNYFQYISVFLLPNKIKIWLFNKYRNLSL